VVFSIWCERSHVIYFWARRRRKILEFLCVLREILPDFHIVSNVLGGIFVVFKNCEFNIIVIFFVVRTFAGERVWVRGRWRGKGEGGGEWGLKIGRVRRTSFMGGPLGNVQFHHG
jgi:hypothetical protein